MFAAAAPTAASKTELYVNLNKQLKSLLDGERDFIANAANFSALLFNLLPDLNWAGFYLLHPASQGGADGDSGELVLGPFQGKPACVRIALGRGVCGTAAAERRTQLVPDVHAFPGHIACDAASRSEIVVPLIRAADGGLIGVLDLDSPVLGRFDATDQAGLEKIAATLVASLG